MFIFASTKRFLLTVWFLMLAALRIVILSALNSQDDIVKGFNAGADDFITKPIIMEKLLSCVITQMQLVENARR